MIIKSTIFERQPREVDRGDKDIYRIITQKIN